MPSKPGKPVSPKKSPHQKRAEAQADREQWSQEQIDEAIRANGGTPKPRPAGVYATDGANPPRGPGRPSKYPKMDLERIEEQARGGLTKREIAWANDICYDTLRVYQKEFSAFSAAIERGRKRRVKDFENALQKVALGYTVPEDKVQYDNQVGQWQKTTVLKQYPPDTKALHILLQKAETGSYKPKADLNHGGEVTAKVVHVYGPQKKPEGHGA